jgi:tetratricopeptide (TPR) repeat protein
MNQLPARELDVKSAVFPAGTSPMIRHSITVSTVSILLAVLAFSAAISEIPDALAAAQSTSATPFVGLTIRGRVLDPTGKPIEGASIHLQRMDASKSAVTSSDANGAFAFPGLLSGTYSLAPEKAGIRGSAASVTLSSEQKQSEINLVLSDSTIKTSSQVMEFADNPSFTVAGVTDWTAAGGHGSDASLRTSEALTRETLTLKPDSSPEGAVDSGAESARRKEIENKLRAALTGAPANFEANHRLGELYLEEGRFSESASLLKAAYQINPADSDNESELAQACLGIGDVPEASQHARHLLADHGTADVHRLAGAIDEKLGDPLAAVHEYEQAARMDPSEQNYFEWGSELLFHRAILQAREVFEQGVKAYPKSARTLTALGSTLFASALYDEAAHRLCSASDLNPADPEPYLFMGKIEIAAPNPLPCVGEKLARFVELQPDNALANYFYAMAVWKEHGPSADSRTLSQVEAMLTKAVAIDSKCADAYLQLGNLHASLHQFPKAIESYKKAIEANPQLSDAHYRLGMSYDRVGETDMAKAEFQLHDEIEKQNAEVVERQRKEVKQFVVVLPDKPKDSPLN